MPKERAKVNSRRGILICGSYGHGNAGDEAILEAIIAAFRGKDPIDSFCGLWDAKI